MDQLSTLLSQLSGSYPIIHLVLTILGSLVVIGQIVVALTPTQADDAKLAEIEKGFVGTVLDILSKFAVIQKK